MEFLSIITKIKKEKNYIGLQIAGWETLFNIANRGGICLQLTQTQAILLYFTLHMYTCLYNEQMTVP